MHMNLLEFDLPLKHTFTISRGSVSVQTTLIVELEHRGLRGYGEATTNTYYGVTIQNMVRALEEVRADVEAWDGEDPGGLWDSLHPRMSESSFAQCALDQAAYDLWGKLHGKPVYELWGLEPVNLPVSNFTIGIDQLDVMVAKLQEVPDWPVYKIKLGTADDLAIIRRLREETGAVFRVDANCGWSAEETLERAAALADLGVEFIEQPLPADRWDDMLRVYAGSPLPLIADESCLVPADVDRCQGHFHGVNIKLTKCGGLTPARRMIQRAKELGLKVMVGCMTESTVGISAIAQLLPLLDYVDMDGAALLAEDIAGGVVVQKGVCRYPQRAGCGVELTAPERGRSLT